MWLFIGLGATVDWLLTFAAQQAGIILPFGYAVACLVSVLVKNFKSQVGSKADQALPAEAGNVVLSSADGTQLATAQKPIGLTVDTGTADNAPTNAE